MSRSGLVGVTVVYGRTIAVREVDLDLHGGEVVALMGRNGSGKSSLLWAHARLGPRGSTGATVDAGRARDRARAANPADLLYLPTVAEECAQADADVGRHRRARAGRCSIASLPASPSDAHPRDLSEGQRLALVLAIQLTAAPEVLLLDEPTRGLDPTGQGAVRRRSSRDLAADGHAVVVATHDVEFVARCADRVVVLAEGEVVADGPTADIVVRLARVRAPGREDPAADAWLTVDEVAEALA